MWAFALRHRTAYLNEMVTSWRIRGALRVDLLDKATTQLVARHPTLRTRLSYRRGRLDQLTMPVQAVPLHVSVMVGPSLEGRLQAATAAIADPMRQHVDVLNGPTLIARLFRVDDEDHILSLSVHHAMCDGWSLQIMLRDLLAFYDAAASGVAAVLPPLQEQFFDVALREVADHREGRFAEEISFWRAKLDNLPPPLALPAAAARRGNRDWSSSEIFECRPRAFLDRVREVAKWLRVSPFAFFASALAVELRRRSNVEDLLLGVPTLNRWTEESLQFVGYATSMLPLRVQLSADLTFAALSKLVNASVREMLAHGRVPLELLLRETSLARHGNVLFPVWCQYLEGKPAGAVEGGGLRAESIPTVRNSLMTELDVDLAGLEDGWRCDMAYRPALFPESMVRSLMTDFITTLETVVQDPGMPVGRLG
jgi:hypothetical protein